MLDLFTGLELNTVFMLVLTLIFVLIYEAINGFHDTANAVAIVIYTRAMSSKLAVTMSGIFNFLGVLMGGLSVAYAIVHLLPIDLLLNVSSAHGLAMMFAMLLAAIIWNIGTWYLSLPASSSHTIIGAIIGIGLTNAWLTNSSLMQALNIPKLLEILLSLIISLLVGAAMAGAIVFILRRYCWDVNENSNSIHMTPTEREQKDGEFHPPFWTRIALIFSAAGVSFSHGANDGQKGIGLIMLLLIGVSPAGFIVNMNASGYDISRTLDAVNHLQQYYTEHYKCSDKNSVTVADVDINTIPPRFNNQILISKVDQMSPVHSKQDNYYYKQSQAIVAINQAAVLLRNLQCYNQLTPDQRSQVRSLLIYIADITNKAAKQSEISKADKRYLINLSLDLLNTIEYAPLWIIISVALALSLGTMVGWRSIATTICEKIGTKDMTYAQGLSVQMTAAASIGIASYTGIPVSTTHVLSSSVTGTILADGGGIQYKTVKNILLAWVLTLPCSIALSGSLYWLALTII